ncbi:hypothetical protein BH747_13015 [Enterococcus villorum]|uniref:DUF1048 domain-containing protein n=2 Tax=Enterococcus villorum TaxID=112904 RepID=A0A1V8Y6W9_9ENTE|nr:DUF1048 domain-containing protein [Enterococcus villorum]OQO68066.1 hypothetical protein BH747_13015 [Enterococcus villorum]OQO72925.1 hypothetical protein BH744_10740 [Enterococcus villorum]
MMFRKMIEEKKDWHAYMNRVKKLPEDYQMVYKECRKYFFKVLSVETFQMAECLQEILDLFEEGSTNGKAVLDITGKDIAAFCDGLIESQKY